MPSPPAIPDRRAPVRGRASSSLGVPTARRVRLLRAVPVPTGVAPLRAVPAARALRARSLNAPVPAVIRPDFLAVLPLRLFRAERPLPYIVVAWLMALIPSLGLSALVSQLVPGQGPQLPTLSPAFLFFMLVIFAPVIETLIMGAILLLVERIAGFVPALLVSAAGWGIAHSLQAPAWGLVIWWPFLIFSLAFLVWRRRSLALAFALPMAIHALQNLVPALLLVSGMDG